VRASVAAGGRRRESVPPSFVVYDREGGPAMDVAGHRSYFGNGSDVMHVHDLETASDALPDIDFVMSGAWPDGMEAREAYPRQFNAMVKATTKPLVMTAGGVDTVEPMWRTACEVRGGAEALRAKPYFVMYNQPVSPLEHRSRPSTDCSSAPTVAYRRPTAPRRSPEGRLPSPLQGRSRWASPRRSSAWSCTSCERPAPLSSSVRVPTSSTWLPRSRPTTPGDDARLCL
jgi:hypothetical protein